MDNEDFVLIEKRDGEQDEEEAYRVTPEDIEKIQTWLSPTEFDSDGSEYRKHLNAHAPGTGDWLLKAYQFIEWHESLPVLWIQGIPGSGKSVLAARVIQSLKEENIPVLFFFARRIIKSNSDPSCLVRDCLYQLLDHSALLQSKLKALRECSPDINALPFHELWRILTFALAGMPKVYIVFDALDELSVEKDHFLKCLLELGSMSSDTVKLVVTSRPIPNLQTALNGPFLNSVRLLGQRIEDDISTYVTHRMLHQTQRFFSDHDQSLIKATLLEKSPGLFLYVRLMLDEILQQSRPLQDHLHALPTSLADMYVDLLHEHSTRSGASRRFQCDLLSWITHSSRPLRVTELVALVNSHSDRNGLEDSQDTRVMVRTACGPLLEILDDETVQIIHHSFTEFLLDDTRNSTVQNTTTKWFPALVPAEIHRSLTISCIEYLQSGCLESLKVEDRPTDLGYQALDKQKHAMIQNHFLQYASQNLLCHAEKCIFLDEELKSKLNGLFVYGSHDFEVWKDLIVSKKDKLTPDKFLPLHVAAQAGLDMFASYLIENGSEVDAKDSHDRTALFYAAMEGHAKTVQCLLDNKASAVIHDADGMTPLHFSAQNNHKTATEYLLNAGSDPLCRKPKENRGWHACASSFTANKSPLQYACETGNINLIPLLMSRLAPTQYSRVLPHWASCYGHANILSLLLDYPDIKANINKLDPCGNTALYLTSKQKHAKAVGTLLDHGAEVNILCSDFIHPDPDQRTEFYQDSMNVSPIQAWAATTNRNRHSLIVSSIEDWEGTATLLLEAGADVESKDSKGRSILFSWVQQGFRDHDRAEEFVTLLLKYGANPRIIDNDGNTLLHEFPRHMDEKKRSKVVALLTRAGTDINHVRKGDLMTPLIVAAKAQCTDCSALINNGAKPNIQDRDGDTALHHICRSWLTEYSDIERWLESCDPTILNNRRQTPLYRLRYGNRGDGRVKAIKLFLDKGVNIESKDRDGCTALLAACKIGEKELIRGFLEHGADAKTRDHENKSCLHHIVSGVLAGFDHGPKDKKVFLDIAKIFIEAGVDINGVDNQGNTPFMTSIGSQPQSKHASIVLEPILELGGIANLRNNLGQTAMHKLASLKDFSLEQLDFLLEERIELDINARDHEGRMPIHVAASTATDHDSTNVLDLVRKGADVAAQAYSGKNSLHFAAEEGKSNLVGYLCTFASDHPSIINQEDELGRTPLHYATKSGSPECVYYLLKAGSNPNAQDRKGMTPAHTCAEYTVDFETMVSRRENKAGRGWVNNVPDSMQKLAPFMDMERENPVHKKPWWLIMETVCEENRPRMRDIIGALIAAGGDMVLKDENGMTTYEVALVHGREELLEALCETYQDYDPAIFRTLGNTYYKHRRNMIQDIVDRNGIDDQDSFSLLQTAIYLGDRSILSALLRKGADPYCKGPGGLTSIHTIAHWGLLSMMEIAACYIDDINAFSPPLLHVAAVQPQSNIQMIDLLIKLGVDVSVPYTEPKCGDLHKPTPLPSYTAAHLLAPGEYWWSIAALESLCAAGADLELFDAQGNTVLQCALSGQRSGMWWAAGHWRDDTLEVLLRHGANINTISPETKSTPLTAALESKREAKLIQRLLDAGTDITLGDIPAIFIAVHSSRAALEALIEAGGDVNAIYCPETRRQYGSGPEQETPLTYAALSSNISITDDSDIRESNMELLLEKGADPLMKLQDGKTTVLHVICRHHGLVAPIVKYGIDLEARDAENRTLLHVACSPSDRSNRYSEDESTPRDLILAGANIHTPDNDGNTPLSLAAAARLSKTVTLLLEKGADVSETNKRGLSPIYYAMKKRMYSCGLPMIIKLLDNGADTAFRGLSGETAYHLIAPNLLQNSQNGYDPDAITQFKALYQRFIASSLPLESRDNARNTPLFPYLGAKIYQDCYDHIPSPTEEDVKWMLDLHDVLAVNNDGDTLLHVVAGREDESQLVKFEVWLFGELMRRGCDARRGNKVGVSALDVAAACGKEGILGMFAREEV